MKNVILFLLFFLILFLFKQWLMSPSISAGDFPYYFSINQQTILYPYSWLGLVNIGAYNVPFTVNLFPVSAIVFFLFNIIHIPWNSIAKFVYFCPTIFLSIFTPYFLSSTLNFDKRFSIFAIGIFFLNTYMLMILDGGQMLLALAVSSAPLLLGIVIKRTSKFSLRTFVILGILYALEIGLDLRITYILLVAIIIFIFIKSVIDKSWKYAVQSFGNLIVFPFIIAVLLHMFWILPTIFVHQNPLQQLGTIYSSVGAVKFFSFAKFEDAFGLLHPNWPENIFGLTHFMRPEFFLLPLLAYGSLLFIKPFDSLHSIGEKQEQLYVLFFSLLGLLGTFLAKGANDPFGGIYLWMFGHIPGFIMFRDPTKWYLLIVLSYSMLIPYAVSKIYDFLQRRFV